MWTNLNYQLAEATPQRWFLLKCRSNDIHPQHMLNLSKRIRTLSFHSLTCKQKLLKINRHITSKLLNLEILDINFHINFLKKSLSTLKNKILKLNIDMSSINNFFAFTDQKSKRILNKHEKILKRKFDFLFNKMLEYSESIVPKQFFKNLTDTQIPNQVIDVVSLGPKFSIRENTSKKDIIDTVKNVEISLRDSEVPSALKSEIREKVSSNLRSGFRQQKHMTTNDRNLNIKLRETKKFIKNNPDIMFTTSDKGNVTVCLYKADYNEKMLKLLSDGTTYENVKKNPLKKLQTDTSKILKNLNNNNYLHTKFHNNALTFTNTTLAKCYGLPKIHKKDVPYRPIISLINSPTHFLAKTIYKEIQFSVKPPKSHINNSFELKQKLNSVIVPNDYILLSLDVTSLFTNIPLQLVLDSLDKRFDSIHNKCKIPFVEIVECTKFLFANTFFSFNNNYYRQIEGTPMGSPISPLFANMVMDDLETNCLSTLKEKHNVNPLLYFRYVDDTIMCINKKHIDLVVKTFNSYNNRLQFTYEIEQENKINFLDMTLIRHNNTIITDWFNKPTSSGRLINFLSNHPTRQKINIVYNLVDRAISLSHKQFHKKNLDSVFRILQNNNFPRNFINRFVYIRLHNIKDKGYQKNKIQHNRFTPLITLPFNDLFNKISSILKSFNFRTLPVIKKSFSSIIKLGKDITEKWDRTNVVYKFECKSCPASYVGETKRTVKTRIKEHQKNNNPDAVVFQHMSEHSHEFDWNNTKILDYDSNYYKRLISEMIHIKSNKNNINKKEDVKFLNPVYFQLLRLLN